MATNTTTAAAAAADFDDMNATPLGKLPMPIMQSKADAPKVDLGAASVSYADILRTMGTGEQASPQQPPQQQPLLQASLPPQQAPQFQQQSAQAMQAPPAQHMALTMDDRYYARPPSSAKRRRRRWSPPRNGGRTLLSRWLGAYKNAAIVLAIVFVVTLMVAPRLAATLPALARPGMRLTPAGLALVALLCGGIYRAAEHVL